MSLPQSPSSSSPPPLDPSPPASSLPSPPEEDPATTTAASGPGPTRASACVHRLPRACTTRTNRPPSPIQERRPSRKEREEKQQNSKVVTPLAPPVPSSPALLPRWGIRSMWEMASLLNFLHVFRPLLNIVVEFSAEELETALIMPNSTLDDVHIPLLKAIPPVTRMALGRATWVTVLCRKLKDWWHWVADGEIPIVASHGAEVQMYKTLEPATRVLILKALCDIRVERTRERGQDLARDASVGRQKAWGRLEGLSVVAG